ncbi:MAG: glycosyltransferase [Betaproteobacteria bacterium]
MTARASIVVRSMGRPELADALAALAAQAYDDIEVVLVDASGGRHPPPPARCGRFPLVFVPGDAPRTRPVAANAGFDAATGELLGLLDDDDLIEPAHVANLVAALGAQADAIAAYSVSHEIDALGRTLKTRAQRWSRLLLFQDSYLVSNSVLFRRTAFERCRFDERFDICEDWEYWIQISELGEFAFVEADTAISRPLAGTSGTGRGANRDDASCRRYIGELATKWSARGEALAAEIEAAAAAARALHAQGRADDAEAAALRVLERYPFEVSMLNLTGMRLAQRGDIAGALARFRLAAAEAPGDPNSGFNHALALERLGRDDEALAEYDRVLAFAPTHAPALARRAIVARQRNPGAG